MNRCDIEEDETTKVLLSIYQASAPESSKSTRDRADGSTYAPLPSGIDHPSTMFNLNGKHCKNIKSWSKLTASKEYTKNLLRAVKSTSLNDPNYSPAGTKLDNSHQKQSSDYRVEESNKSSKDDLRLHELSSNEGKH